jgi:molecular chaperone HscB
MDISKNFFELFELAPGFDLNTQQLSERYRELQREYHPDRHAHKGEREQRLAVQATTHLNEAFETLKQPLQRAQYLLKLRGVETGEETRQQLPGAFLMQQMELREALFEVGEADDPFAELEDLEQQARALETQEYSQFNAALAADDLETAEVAIRKLQFVNKLLHEIEAAEDRLDEEY